MAHQNLWRVPGKTIEAKLESVVMLYAPMFVNDSQSPGARLSAKSRPRPTTSRSSPLDPRMSVATQRLLASRVPANGLTSKFMASEAASIPPKESNTLSLTIRVCPAPFDSRFPMIFTPKVKTSSTIARPKWPRISRSLPSPFNLLLISSMS